jgi:polyhydroxyalkanoate synthase
MSTPSEWQQTLLNFIQHYGQTQERSWEEACNVGQIYYTWLQQIQVEPQKLTNMQTQFFEDYVKFLTHYQEKCLGSKMPSYIPIPPTDKRFRSPDWSENPFFYFYQQLYLLFSKHCIEFIDNHPVLDKKLAKQVSFFSRQALNALAPSNFALTNPDVIKRTIETQGENLAKGYQNFIEDLSRGQGHWTIKMTDMQAFDIGENVAVTKGKVIFQNKLIQLIQYSPLTEEVYQTPFLMVPPWINKYYVLDLREQNSYVKWIVEQGYTVFMISWINPDESLRDVSFEDYLFEGLLSALNVVTEVTGEQEVNMLGFCVGGTLLAVALAYLQQKQQSRIKSATFLTTLIDFSSPGDIEVFMDEEQISDLEKQMAIEGYLDGRTMMMTFNLLRSNDLYWSYFVSNYLCGQDPFPFDLLYWNCDSTNLPAKMHSEYLRKFYLHNEFFKNTLDIAGLRLTPTDIKTPAYFISTEQDHIAPWKATFYGAKALRGEVEFVLGGSGHIAGVVNAPEANKYGYKTNSQSIEDFKTPEEWLTTSAYHDGSWWVHWEKWLERRSGQKIKKRIPGSESRPVIEDAPGTFVKRKINKI